MVEDPDIVLDASVAIALVLQEPSATVIRTAIRRWADANRTVVVPSIFWLELVNPLARQHRYTSQDLLEAVIEIEGLDLVTVDPDRPILLLTIDHMERYGLTAYDAHYLALATQLGGELATLDHALAAAAGARAISFGARRLSEGRGVYEHDVTWPKFKGASAYLAKIRADAAAPRTA